MRVLITGATGFVGRHLSRLALSKKNTFVYGLVRRSSDKLEHGVRSVRADLLSKKSLLAVLRKTRPDRIYHLAGQSSVARSWKETKMTFDVNVGGTRALLEAARLSGTKARILICGSADEYGASGKGSTKLKEDAPLKPLSPYGVSKVEQGLLGRHYYSEYGLHVVRTRAFNHIGPGQAGHFVVPGFARQIADIVSGAQKAEIKVGNLEAVRDFTDVRDVVRAYWLALEKGKAGEVYNICTGRPRRVADVLRFYLRASSVKIKVSSDPARMRASDVPRLVGDAKKLERAAGWKPRIRFETTLLDVLKEV